MEQLSSGVAWEIQVNLAKMAESVEANRLRLAWEIGWTVKRIDRLVNGDVVLAMTHDDWPGGRIVDHVVSGPVGTTVHFAGGESYACSEMDSIAEWVKVGTPPRPEPF